MSSTYPPEDVYLATEHDENLRRGFQLKPGELLRKFRDRCRAERLSELLGRDERKLCLNRSMKAKWSYGP